MWEGMDSYLTNSRAERPRPVRHRAQVGGVARHLGLRHLRLDQGAALPTGSVPRTRPRRLDRSPITVPILVVDEEATGGRRARAGVTAALAASRRASAPAVWNAMSEESTLWDFPSCSVTRMSTRG